jgi:DNA polymerase-4
MVTKTNPMQSGAEDPWTRIILHADMDAFYAAVEQRDDPSLRDKPLVVGGDLKRGVVSTASYEARRYGLKSAMPMAEAVRLCPDVIVLPPDFERYRAVSGKINEVFHNYSPLVEPLSLDEAFIDMTGAEALFGKPVEMARKIKKDVLA